MCCFSRPVNDVRQTRIFARLTKPGHQAVAYAMSLDAPEELAMILPLPVTKGCGEDALTFINLEKYPKLFADLAKTFPVAPTSRAPSLDAKAANSILKVVSVGAFEASFVPTVADFARLDPRFILPEGTWDKLPAYRDFGFAVFKLKAGRQDVHPMAFTFPTRHQGTLFFPTVHIHDGKVHARAGFDHVLYGQAWPNARLGVDWEESTEAAQAHVDLKRAQDLVWGEGHIYRKRIIGMAKNEDILAKTYPL